MTTEPWNAADDRRLRVRTSERVGWLDDMAARHRSDEDVAARYSAISEALAETSASHSILMRVRAAASHPGRPDALAIVMAERRRQSVAEGYDPGHDDEHGDGSILAAARCYLAHVRGPSGSGAPADWPWEPETWKPRDRERALAKAGALARAEAERIERAGGIPVEANEVLELVLWEILA